MESKEEMLKVCREKLKRCRGLGEKIEQLKSELKVFQHGTELFLVETGEEIERLESKLKEREESVDEMKTVTSELKEIVGKHRDIVYCLNCHEAYLKDSLPSKRLLELKILKYTVVDYAHGETTDGERSAKKISELSVYTCPNCNAELYSEVIGRYPYKIGEFFEINGELYSSECVKKTTKVYDQYLDHTLESWERFDKKLDSPTELTEEQKNREREIRGEFVYRTPPEHEILKKFLEEYEKKNGKLKTQDR